MAADAILAALTRAGISVKESEDDNRAVGWDRRRTERVRVAGRVSRFHKPWISLVSSVSPISGRLLGSTYVHILLEREEARVRSGTGYLVFEKEETDKDIWRLCLLQGSQQGTTVASSHQETLLEYISLFGDNRTQRGGGEGGGDGECARLWRVGEKSGGGRLEVLTRFRRRAEKHWLGFLPEGKPQVLGMGSAGS
ncbi:hypothetical protein L210DRAFT_3500651 [Boletus edulis BED1]|uniref:Uncharacterized protein n=1 Tax=Boletus edulis BED1 TaxID=1328754 RepID=A0AAD4GK76_BOLED|nr:hypothetical protein L210DRAFT_3500651 [Boletus edulis BED1]